MCLTEPMSDAPATREKNEKRKAYYNNKTRKITETQG